MIDQTIYLRHILEAIENIERSCSGVLKGNFKKNRDLQDATIRRLEVIGEAVKNLSEKIKKKYPEVEWKKIVGTRDILIHVYFSVDMDIIWNIVREDIPNLKKGIEKILKEV